MMMNLPISLFKTANHVSQLISIEVALIIISVKGKKGGFYIQSIFIQIRPLRAVCVRWWGCQRTCFAPADGRGLPAFGRALDGDLLV